MALISDFRQAEARRLDNWRQTPDNRLAGPDEAVSFIERVGVATLYPVSPEIPDLFHAYVGDPAAPTDSGHDTPSGEVYSWRWALGWREAACYVALVRSRPTWVSWPLLPAILRLRGEPRPVAELYAAGELSADAWRVARALAEAGGVLGTGELRRAAGFPTGKAERAVYLKAVAELDARRLLAKVFAAQDTEMRHALVGARYPREVAAAGRLTREEALEQFLLVYLPPAVYAAPAALARHLGLPEAELRASLARLAGAGRAVATPLPGRRGDGYVWGGE
ncbi:MAG TPA: hypothetical protein VFW96_22185 [Thermomicrobiales bacterium]|nr:hypothetical protein [Thermomicrobiales bacterium]